MKRHYIDIWTPTANRTREEIEAWVKGELLEVCTEHRYVAVDIKIQATKDIVRARGVIVGDPTRWFLLTRQLNKALGAVLRHFKKDPMNKYSERGLTLVELMIILVILILLGAGLIGGVGVGCNSLTSDTVRDRATGYARHYSRQFKGWPHPIVDCAGDDTDNNSYVSCTIAEGVGKPSEQIECPANRFTEYNRSCRVPQLRSVQWPGGVGQ